MELGEISVVNESLFNSPTVMVHDYPQELVDISSPAINDLRETEMSNAR